MAHDHAHDAQPHAHRVPRPTRKRLALAAAIAASFCAVELLGAYLSNSLALLSDAGHLVADVFSILLALFALHFAERPATPTKSYGWYRLEILAALANGVLLCLVAVFLLREAWHRVLEPHPVHGGVMLGVAAVGFVVNLISARLLHDSACGNLNVRGAYLHVVSDLLASIGVFAGAVAILLTGSTRVDPIIAALIAALILWSAQQLVRESVDVLLEAIPKGIETCDVNGAILATEGVVGIHDLHIWSLTTGVEALSVHVIVKPEALPQTDRILRDINVALAERFHILHTTIQLESAELPHLGTVH